MTGYDSSDAPPQKNYGAGRVLRSHLCYSGSHCCQYLLQHSASITALWCGNKCNNKFIAY